MECNAHRQLDGHTVQIIQSIPSLDSDDSLREHPWSGFVYALTV
jgi:hypothetical protein